MRWFALALSMLALPLDAQEFTTLKGHGGPIMGIAVGRDGQIATASFDNSVGLWDSSEPRWLDGHEAAVNDVLIGADGTVYSGGDDFTIRVWTPARDEVRTLQGHRGKVVSLALSPDGQRLASASWDGTIGLWQGADQMVIASGHDGPVNDVVFAADGQMLYSASADGTIRVWDGQSGAPVQNLITHGFGVNQLVLAPEGDWLAYGAVDGGTRVIDLESGEEIADFTLDRRPILSMAHDPVRGQLAVGDGEGYIMVIDTRAWKIARDFRATRKGPVWALAFSRDGRVIHAGGLDDVAYSWPVELLDKFEPGISGARSFLRDAASMPNGERQFMRKCSICHALEPGPSRKAGPTLHGLFGRPAGEVAGYAYSDTLETSDIIWTEESVDALFDQGPDHYIPGSKMPMQVIAGSKDRADLVAFLRQATKGEQ